LLERGTVVSGSVATATHPLLTITLEEFRMKRVTAISIIALSLASTVASQGQGQAARPSAGDTLRYRQTMTMRSETEVPGSGMMTMKMDQSSRMAIAFATGDTVRVWFDSIAAKMTSPMGEMALPLDAMLNKPFVLTMSSGGDLKLISSPPMPSGDMGITQPDPKSFGFNFQRPPGALTIGQSWTDTTESKLSAEPGGITGRTITTYRVASDTTLAGERALIIETTGTTSTGGAQVISGMNVQVTSTGETLGRTFLSRSRDIVLQQSTSTKSTTMQKLDMNGTLVSTTATQVMEMVSTLIR
jgi:hypothetical protein